MGIPVKTLVGYSLQLLADVRKISGDLTVQRIDAEMKRRRDERPAEAVPQKLDYYQPRPKRRASIIFSRLPPSHNAIWIPVIDSSSGRPTIVMTREAKDWKSWARGEIEIQWASCPYFTGPVDVETFCIMADDRRDTQNLEKLLWDTLEGICYANDRLIRDRNWSTRIGSTFADGALFVEIADHLTMAERVGEPKSKRPPPKEVVL